MYITHLSLDHLHPLFPESVDNTSNVHHSCCLSLLQSYVDGDEGPSTTHTSTAVNQDGSSILPPVGHHLLAKYHEWSAIFRDTVVRPGGEVVLGDGVSILSNLRRGMYDKKNEE